MRSLEILTTQLLLPAFLLFALVWALVGAVIGVGLITSKETTLRFFAWVDSWVSARTRLKWAELGHDSDRAVFAYRVWFAVVFIAGGIFTLVLLLKQYDVSRMAVRPQFVLAWLLESAKWLLVLGSVLAIAVGMMLAFFPTALHTLETYANHWVSTRQATRSIGESGDRMHLVLDRVVAAYPRASGWIVVVLSVSCIFTTGSALLAR